MSQTSKREKKEIKSEDKSELKNEILNICEPLCLKIVKDKPSNIIQYMMKYLRNKYNYTSSLLQNEEKKELYKLKQDLNFFHEQEENTYYVESYHKNRKEVKSPEKKGKNISKHKQRIPPDEIIPSDDEDYNNHDDIDTRLDDINFIKENSYKEKRSDYFEIKKKQDEKLEINYNEKPKELFDFLKNNLIKSPLFSELSYDILIKCINAMTEVNYKAMSDVVRQGDFSDNFYIVIEGELECKMGFTIIKKEGNRTKVEKYDPKLVKVYYPGDYFCELNLLYQIPIRGTIKAIVDTKLYSIDRKTYKYILNSSYIEKTKNEIELFKKLPIFETLLDDEFVKITKISREEIYYKGETIIRENEYINKLMIIKEGICTGYKITEKGKKPKKTREYQEEDFFGKSALLKEELSDESIIATSDIVKFICIDRYAIKNIFGSLELMLMRDNEIYEKYFPPIPEYSEQEPMKENTKSLILSFEGENANPNNNVNMISIDDNKLIANHNFDNNENDNNINNINIQSRNNDKKSLQPEKINSLSYNLGEISRKLSKEKDEEYESEIKRLKEEVSILKNQLENKKDPEQNNDLNNMCDVKTKNYYQRVENPENIIKQESIEKEMYSSNNNNNIINKELNVYNIINSDNKDNNNINEIINENNNFINDNLNNNNVNYELNQPKISDEQDSNKNEINDNLNNLEININKDTNKSIENLNSIKMNDIEENKRQFEEFNSEVIKNDGNNFINNFNNNENQLNFENLNRSNDNKINNKTDSFNNSINNSNINDRRNNSQIKGARLRNMDKFKNLANLELNDMDNSIRNKTNVNKSIKNGDDFKIDSINSNKNKKNKSEIDINKKDSQNNFK